MTRLANITQFENICNIGNHTIYNVTYAQQLVPTKPDVEFGWKYKWGVNSAGKLGVNRNEDVASLGKAVNRSMGVAFANLKLALLRYNREAANFTNNMKALYPQFARNDKKWVADVLSGIRSFQAAGGAFLKDFNIQMPVAR